MQACILVVEDDDLIREVMATVLTEEGYEVDLAADGVQAWTYLADRQPALVVLDLALPGVDGLTLCRRLRASEAKADIPVLVVSAMSSGRGARAALEAGADAFLDKPFDLGDLVGQVQALLARPPQPTGAPARG